MASRATGRKTVKSGAQRKDPAWKHGVQVEGERGYVYIRCNYCSKVIKGGVKRMKDHIGGTHKNVQPCTKAPEEAKKECLQYMKKYASARQAAQEVFEEMAESANWWMQFGDEAPELKSFAVKVLSLTCSSSACERNWSCFNQVHTKRRNRLDASRMNNLVYIMYNKKLKDRYLKLKSLKEDEDPLVVEDLPSDDEWIAEEVEREDEREEASSARLKRPREIQESQTNQRRGKEKVQNVTIDEEEWDDLESEEEDDETNYEDSDSEDE